MVSQVNTGGSEQILIEKLKAEIAELEEEKDRAWRHSKAMAKIADREKEQAVSLTKQNKILDRGLERIVQMRDEPLTMKSDYRALARAARQAAKEVE